MVIKNFKSFIDQRFSAFLVAFLMGNLILSFAVGPIYYGFEKIPLPWAFLFFGLYYAGIHAIGGGKERMLRPLVLISLFIFLFLCLFSSLIFLLPLSKSSPARSLLWQKPMKVGSAGLTRMLSTQYTWTHSIPRLLMSSTIPCRSICK